MTGKTVPQLDALSAPVVDSDVLTLYRSPGPLRRTPASTVQSYMQTGVATLATLAASGGSALVGFLQAGSNITARTVQAKLRDTVSLVETGGVANGTTDNGNAFARAFANLTAGQALHIPVGTTLLTAATIASGANPNGFRPPAGLMIVGEGPDSIIRIKRTDFGSFYGFSIVNDNITFRDLTIEVEVDGGSWCAVAALLADKRNLRFENVIFKGIGAISGTYGVTAYFTDFERIVFSECHFDNMEFGGFVKAGEDFSTQTDIVATNCTATNCTEVFEFNSPGIFDGTATSGSAVVTGVSTQTTNIVAGMAIKGPAVPLGTTVLSVDSATQITMSANATATGSKRFSIGTITGIRIENLRVSGMTQWAVGFANCSDFEADVFGEDCDYDLIHIEDFSFNGRVKASGNRCNTTAGQVGSGGADNGAVLIITGSNNIEVELAGFDLRRNTTGTPNGVCVQNGTAGTTNVDAECSNITVRGSVLTKSGTKAVTAYNTDIRYDGLLVDSLATSRASPVFKMSGCRWSGSTTVIEPGLLIAGDNGMQGCWDDLKLISTGSDFAGLTAWTSGAASGFPRNQPPVAAAITYRLNSTADAAATWRTLCPAPYNLNGKFTRKFVGTVNGYETGDFLIKNGALVATFTHEYDGAVVVLNVGAAAPTVTTGDTTNNSNLISALASIANVKVGDLVSGTGIPAGAYVIGVESATTVRISALATATAAGVAITFTILGQTSNGWRINSGNLQFRTYVPGADEVGEVFIRQTAVMYPPAP